ncbi:MAG: hypothetical protein HFJ50_05495 [Clostridia bacterium]|nr:hypothetical protein [Clostridia bacterium]
MNEFEVDLRIKEGAKVDEIIEIFERESLIVQLIATLKRYTYILILIGIIYTVIELLIQRFTIIGIIASILFIGLMIISIYIVAGEISYSYSRKIGGRRAKFLVKKEEGMRGTINYNLKLMKKEEWKLMNKILRVNHLDSMGALRELRGYYSRIRKKRKISITHIYTLPKIEKLIVEIILNKEKRGYKLYKAEEMLDNR